MRLIHRLIHRFLPLPVWLALSATGAAQPAVLSVGEHGTTITGFAGVASDSAATGPVLGGAVGWELTPGLTLEGAGSWLEFGSGSSGFAGDLSVRTRLFGRRTVDPFVRAGVGLYRASYDLRHDLSMPAFYRDRLPTGLPENLVMRSFTDPTMVIGGGANIFLARHLAIRPDVQAIVVLRDRRRHLVTTASIHAVMHFEEHPVTPSRRR